MPKISVIMPMYNVEKYVALAIHSLLNQTFKDFEAIFIDDCSNDRTLEIAKSFDDPRIKIIQNEKNLGVWLSRNAGLKAANGEYIYSFDSDDVLMPKAFETFINAIEKNDADVVSTLIHLEVVGDQEFINLKDKKIIPRGRGPIRIVSSDIKKRLIEEYCYGRAAFPVWLSMYRKSFLEENNIEFRKIFGGGDHFFLVEILCAAKKIIKINEGLYIYRRRIGSLSKPNVSIDFNKLINRLEDVFSIPGFCDKVISKAFDRKDYFLINFVAGKFIEYLMEDHILPFYKSSPEKVLKIINEQLQLKYDQSTSMMISSVLYGFILKNLDSKNFKQENEQLKLRMKAVKENVNKLIPF